MRTGRFVRPSPKKAKRGPGQRSTEVLKVDEGALYPALHRLEVRGLLRSKWGLSENNRRAKFYSLTAAGRRELEHEATAWRRVSAAIARVMKTS